MKKVKHRTPIKPKENQKFIIFDYIDEKPQNDDDEFGSSSTNSKQNQ